MSPENIVSTPVPSSPWRGWIQLLLGLGLTVLFFFMMAPYVVAILIGGVLAILCYPQHEKLKAKIPASLSSLLLTFAITVGVLAPLIFTLYTVVYRTFTLLNKWRVMKEGQTIEQFAEHPFMKRLLHLFGSVIPIDQDWLHEQALNFLGNVVESISGIIANFLTSMPGLIVAFVVVILSTYFFLNDGARFLRFLQSLSPLKADRSKELYGSFEKSCRGVVLGLFLSALAQAILIVILFFLTGLPNPFVAGFFTIILGMVPLIGSSPMWILAAIYLGANGMYSKMAIMIAGGVVVSTIDNVIRPWVMKGHAEMHPLLALVSVFGAVRLMGPTGIFLGPVIAAVFVSFLRILSIELRRDSMAAAAP
jgi:predicted PurR-regulated permease PerM